MMLRKSVLEQVGGYSTDHERQPPEDYELWSRIARRYEIANIPELLQIYREIPRSMSRDGISPFMNHLVTITTENIAWAAGVMATDPDPVNIAALAHFSSHRICGKPNFRSMREILLKAVARVTCDDIRFQEQVENKIEQLRHVHQPSRSPSVGKRFYFFLKQIKNNTLSGLKKQER